MIDSNILKIAGALIAGLAGIIGILWQTRTADNKLTRYGKWLFGMAIVGVVLAVSTQIWEWRKSIEADRASRQKNQELLLKLDTEVQLAAKSLHEVKRAVTRFDTISFDWSVSFDNTNGVVGPYIRELAKLAEEAVSKSWSFDFDRSDQGLHSSTVDPKSGQVSGFAFAGDSPAMPEEGKYPLLRHYILEAVPVVAVFKTPISPKNYVPVAPNPFRTQQRWREPDLILKPNSGKVSILFPIQKVEPTVPKITVLHRSMDVSTLYTSGAIVSLEDLRGSQAIISFSFKEELQELWRTASNHSLTFRVNDQIIAIGSDSDSLLSPGPVVSRLISTKTVGSLSQQLYSFTFPEAAPAKVNH
jgi:hypothetical protein